MLLLTTMVFSSIFLLIEIAGVSKVISKFLAITPLFFLFVMVGFNRFNSDYSSYKYLFLDDSGVSQFEFGYVFLVKIMEYFGQDHEAIIFISGGLLVFTLLKMMKSSKHVNLVIFFYCIFPLIYDLNQIRNTIMYLIVILSLGFIEKGRVFKYYIGIFIAFSIHKFALIYTPLYYLCKKERKKFISLTWKLFFIFSIASPLIVKLFSWLFPYKIGVYLSLNPDFGVIILAAYTFIDIFTVWWVDKKIRSKLSEEESKKMEILYRFVWFSVLVLPFTAYIFELKRLQRNVLLVKYIYCALAMSHLSVKEKLVTVLLLLISVSMPIIVMIYSNRIDLFNDLDKNSIKSYLDTYLF